ARAPSDAGDVAAAGVLASSAGPAGGADPPPRPEPDVAEREDGDRSARASAARAFLVSCRIEGRHRKGVPHDRVATAATARAGPGLCELPGDLLPSLRPHRPPEIVGGNSVVERTRAGGASERRDHAGHRARRERGAVESLLGIEAVDLLVR